MFGTYCTNETCDEYLVAKTVDDELAEVAIQCGACGHPTAPPAEVSAEPGDKVTL
jgi:hypothetical protein